MEAGFKPKVYCAFKKKVAKTVSGGIATAVPFFLSAAWATKNIEGHLCVYIHNGNFIWFVKL